MSDDDLHLPWIAETNGLGRSCVRDSLGRSRFLCNSRRDAEYAVACANACAGINPEAIPELIQTVRHVLDFHMWDGRVREDQLMAALAKLEGDDE